jgi:hypothetical protein
MSPGASGRTRGFGLRPHRAVWARNPPPSALPFPSVPLCLRLSVPSLLPCPAAANHERAPTSTRSSKGRATRTSRASVRRRCLARPAARRSTTRRRCVSAAATSWVIQSTAAASRCSSRSASSRWWRSSSSGCCRGSPLRRRGRRERLSTQRAQRAQRAQRRCTGFQGMVQSTHANPPSLSVGSVSSVVSIPSQRPLRLGGELRSLHVEQVGEQTDAEAGGAVLDERALLAFDRVDTRDVEVAPRDVFIDEVAEERRTLDGVGCADRC